MPGSDDVTPATPGGAPRLKLTYDDYLLFPDDGKRHELIDGEHYVTPSPNLRHQAISGRLYLLIGTWLRDRSTGQIYYAPLDVILSRFDVVDPEIDVIRVYRRSGERFERPVELSAEAGDVLTTPLLPGLEIPLAHVFGN